MIETFNLGDIVEMKKQHPCGNHNFEIIRLGADIKIHMMQWKQKRILLMKILSLE